MKVKERGYWDKSHYVSKSNTGFWTKWGGGRYVEVIDLPEWSCQACNDPQVDVLPSYLFQYPEGEYIKICAMCRYVVIRYELKSFKELLSKVRHTDLFSMIANLLTLPVI